MKLRNSLFLLLASLIWGVAFVAQTEGGDAIGPFSFNGIRNLIGFFALRLAIPLMEQKGIKQPANLTPQHKHDLLVGGFACGTILFVAGSLQQVGLYYGTPAGKAGFLTACYILLVPIVGLVLGKKCGLNIWVGVLIALAGLYLLCMHGPLSLQFSDALVMLCALVFSFHILAVDHFSPLVDGVRLSSIQFLVVALYSLPPALATEILPVGFAEWASGFHSAAWVSLLYAGVLSSGVAYTLQIVGQNGLNPAVASLLMSPESVFSALAGWLILNQVLSGREILGCVLIFAAILLAQIPTELLLKKTPKA